LLLIPAAFVYEPRRLVHLLFAPLLFVLLYSKMPHKELRFVIYVVPLLTAAAAVGCDRLLDVASSASSRSTMRGVVRFVVRAFVVGCVGVGALLSAVSAHSSAWNYPGGEALQRGNARRPCSAHNKSHTRQE
jgi:hypothetical protein